VTRARAERDAGRRDARDDDGRSRAPRRRATARLERASARARLERARDRDGGGGGGGAMKIKTISRVEEDYTRERKSDALKVHRNLAPELRPMGRATEYKRALNATKLDKVFAKPFAGQMSGHADGVLCMAKSPASLTELVSGAADGEIRVWDVPSLKTVRVLKGHRGACRGVSASNDGGAVVSCGDDATIRLWTMPKAGMGEMNDPTRKIPVLETSEMYVESNGFRDCDAHWGKKEFATAGANVQVWSMERSHALHTFEWGSDTVLSVRYNPVETDIFASCGSDRSIALYDVRMQTPLKKIIMQTKSTKLCWNPMEAFNFTVANEDTNLYSYDMRKLDIATCVHKDFVSAVMDIDYSPTGREFVAGSYDRTVRMFDYNAGHSKDCYHTKRMQRVFCTRFSMDGSYVFSASDDMNVRCWKADASAQMGTLSAREKRKHAYNASLKDRFKHMPEIRRIANHHHVPKAIHKQTKLRRTMQEAETRKAKRRVAHAAPGAEKKEFKPARKKKILAEVE
jgi:WD repeat and SOF domain-containing protein 1